jgi:hypothetical protein
MPDRAASTTASRSGQRVRLLRGKIKTKYVYECGCVEATTGRWHGGIGVVGVQFDGRLLEPNDAIEINIAQIDRCFEPRQKKDGG